MATGCSKVTSITIFGNVLDGVIAKKKKDSVALYFFLHLDVVAKTREKFSSSRLCFTKLIAFLQHRDCGKCRRTPTLRVVSATQRCLSFKVTTMTLPCLRWSQTSNRFLLPNFTARATNYQRGRFVGHWLTVCISMTRRSTSTLEQYAHHSTRSTVFLKLKLKYQMVRCVLKCFELRWAKHTAHWQAVDGKNDLRNSSWPTKSVELKVITI